MSTDFTAMLLWRRTMRLLQRNTTALKNVIDGDPRMELLSHRQSGIILVAAPKTLIRIVLFDGDKIQFASRAITVQDCSAEAEKLGVRSLFYQPIREDMA